MTDNCRARRITRANNTNTYNYYYYFHTAGNEPRPLTRSSVLVNRVVPLPRPTKQRQRCLYDEKHETKKPSYINEIRRRRRRETSLRKKSVFHARDTIHESVRVYVDSKPTTIRPRSRTPRVPRNDRNVRVRIIMSSRTYVPDDRHV